MRFIRHYSMVAAFSLFVFILIAAWLSYTRGMELFASNQHIARSRDIVVAINRGHALCSDADVAQIRYLATKTDYERALWDRVRQAAIRDIAVLEYMLADEPEQLQRCASLRTEFIKRMKDTRVIGENCADFLASRSQQHIIIASMNDYEQVRVLNASKLRDALIVQLLLLLGLLTFMAVCSVGIIIGYGMAEDRRDAGLSSFMGAIVNKPEVQ